MYVGLLSFHQALPSQKDTPMNLIVGKTYLRVLTALVLGGSFIFASSAMARLPHEKTPRVSLESLGLDTKQDLIKWKGKPEIVNFSSEGCIEQSKIQRVLSRVKSQVIHCYGRFSAKGSKTPTKVTADIGIGADGSAFQITTSASAKASKEVASCVERIIKRMRFPRCRADEDTFSVWTYEYKKPKTAKL